MNNNTPDIDYFLNFAGAREGMIEHRVTTIFMQIFGSFQNVIHRVEIFPTNFIVTQALNPIDIFTIGGNDISPFIVAILRSDFIDQFGIHRTRNFLPQSKFVPGFFEFGIHFSANFDQ